MPGPRSSVATDVKAGPLQGFVPSTAFRDVQVPDPLLRKRLSLEEALRQAENAKLGRALGYTQRSPLSSGFYEPRQDQTPCSVKNWHLRKLNKRKTKDSERYSRALGSRQEGCVRCEHHDRVFVVDVDTPAEFSCVEHRCLWLC